MRNKIYPLHKPYLSKNEEREIIKVLRSGWLTQGKYAKLFEDQIKKYHKVKYAFLLNSATSGLIAAIKSLGLKKDDEVIVPSFTFPATANAVILGGAKPVFSDINLTTYNISCEKLERLITKHTRAIMPVNEFGLPAEMEKIIMFAKEFNLFVIEDAACSLGAVYKRKKSGTLGNIGVFSFHPRKIMTSGEGGCLITNSQKIAKEVECLRNHGEYKTKFIGCGFNFRLSDLQASILLSQFKKLDGMIERRIKLASNYNRLLKPLEEQDILKRPQKPDTSKHVYQSYVILLSKKINRDKLKNLLKQKGVETQIGTYCVPVLSFYRKNFSIPKDTWKNAYHAYKQALTLPLYYTLKLNEQEFITEELKKAVKKCVE